MAYTKASPKHVFSNIFYRNTTHNFNLKYKGFAAEFGENWNDHEVPAFAFEPQKANIDFKTLEELRSKIEGKTVWAICSGPSLDKNVKYFCENFKDEMGVAISCDGSIHDLFEHSFKPHYVATAEADSQYNRPGIPSTDRMVDNLSDEKKEFYSDVPLICPTWANRRFLEYWPNDDFYYYVNADPRYVEQYTHYPEIFPLTKDGNDPEFPVVMPRTSCVGFHIIDIARVMGAKEVVLIGCDMSVVSKEKHHSKHFNVKWEESNSDLARCYGDHVMWFGQHFNWKFGINTTNCTEGGALTEELTDCKVMTLRERMENEC